MAVTLAFDVYGTLIDTHGVVQALRQLVGERAAEFSQAWRDKQLEYSFRRGLMQNYQSFALCTSQALDYTCTALNLPLSREHKQQLLETYRVLPAFPDAQQGLMQLQDAGVRLFAFSNGTAEAVETLLAKAGIREFFQGVVSVDDLKSFKPNPAVYAHFLRQAQASTAFPQYRRDQHYAVWHSFVPTTPTGRSFFQLASRHRRHFDLPRHHRA
jgi:2-haloacid dehalogenase